MPPTTAYDMTPHELRFTYEESQREKAEDRLAFISDLQAAIAAVWSKEGAKTAAEHCKVLKQVAQA